MKDAIIKRIETELGLTDLTRAFAEISGSDFHSLLLALIKMRVQEIEPASLLAPSAATVACGLDARLLNELEKLAYDLVPQFEALQLSPVTPLGAVSVLTGLDQGNLLSTIRTLECASDPTIGLALECARRRKQTDARKAYTRLCTSQRVLRFPLPQTKGYTAHFNLFSMVTAGRDAGSFTFELDSLQEQLEFYLSFLASLNSRGFCFKDTTVEISHTDVVAHLCKRQGIPDEEIKSQVRARDAKSSAVLLQKYAAAWSKHINDPHEELSAYEVPLFLQTQMQLLNESLISNLTSAFGEVQFSFNLQRLTGLGYYRGPCFHIKTSNSNGEQFMLADGGFVNWTQKLLADKKERLLTSAIGTELICRMFKT